MAKAPASLEALVSGKEIVIVCGPGGVGKTTTAAAFAAHVAAHESLKVLVLTVDPARRLAEALDLPELANTPRRIDPARFSSAGVNAKGELHAAMLDAPQAWESLMRRYAPNKGAAEAILVNPFYENVTRRFAHSHEYIAMERLYELYADGDYDLLVIDTPPSRSALDFLDAPGHMADLFSSRLIRWLVAPARSRLVNLASRPFSQLADHVLGTALLEDIGAFLGLFQGMYPGFVERSQAVSALLRDATTTFIVVSTLEPGPLGEARRLIAELERREVHLGARVANKVLPSSFADRLLADTAEGLASRGALLSCGLATADEIGLAQDALGRVLEQIGANFVEFHQLARREAELLASVGDGEELALSVPHLMTDVTDLARLLEIGGHLFDSTGARSPG